MESFLINWLPAAVIGLGTVVVALLIEKISLARKLRELNEVLWGYVKRETERSKKMLIDYANSNPIDEEAVRVRKILSEIQNKPKGEQLIVLMDELQKDEGGRCEDH